MYTRHWQNGTVRGKSSLSKSNLLWSNVDYDVHEPNPLP